MTIIINRTKNNNTYSRFRLKKKLYGILVVIAVGL